MPHPFQQKNGFYWVWRSQYRPSAQTILAKVFCPLTSKKNLSFQHRNIIKEFRAILRTHTKGKVFIGSSFMKRHFQEWMKGILKVVSKSKRRVGGGFMLLFYSWTPNTIEPYFKVTVEVIRIFLHLKALNIGKM